MFRVTKNVVYYMGNIEFFYSFSVSAFIIFILKVSYDIFRKERSKVLKCL